MSATVTVRVGCDWQAPRGRRQCTEAVQRSAPTLTEAAAKLADLGWRRRGTTMLCPRHAAT